MLRRVAAVALVLVGPATITGEPESRTFTCALSPIIYALPEGKAVSSGLLSWWHVNEDHTIWAAASAPMYAGDAGNKVPWIRPKGTQLTVSGRRLDGDALPARAEIPCCYGGTFQASGLYFPTKGCWEVSAMAGSSRLTFVILVQAP